MASAKKVDAKMAKLREVSDKKEAKPKSAPKKVANVLPAAKVESKPAVIEPIPEQRQPQLKLDQFKVLQFLKQERKSMSRDAILKALGIDVHEKHLASVISTNPKMECSANGHYQFRPRYRISPGNAKEDILKAVKEAEATGGVLMLDLMDSYDGIRVEVDALVRGRLIYLLKNLDEKPPKELLYPIEREHCLYIDRDIQDLWRDVWADGRMPRDCDLDELMEKKGLRMLNIKEDAAETQQSKSERSKKRKRTGKGHSNKHLQ